MLTSDIRKHKEAYRKPHVEHNSNKLKHEPVQNETQEERERIGTGLQRRNCTTHHQKPARHPNTQTYPDATDVGLHDKETSRDKVRRETQAWSAVSVAKRLGTRKLSDKPKSTAGRKNKESVHVD